MGLFSKWLKFWSGKTLDFYRNNRKIHLVTRQDAPLILPCDVFKICERIQGTLFLFKVDVQIEKIDLGDNWLITGQFLIFRIDLAQ
jgi:hypothetical protein